MKKAIFFLWAWFLKAGSITAAVLILAKATEAPDFLLYALAAIFFAFFVTSLFLNELEI